MMNLTGTTMKYLTFYAVFIFTITSHAMVVAKIGSKEITLKELEDKHALLQEQMIDVPDKKELLNDLINFEVGLQEAKKRGLDQDPIIKDRMEQELYKGFVEKAMAEQISSLKVSKRDMQRYYAKYPEIRTSHIMIEVRPDATPEQRAEAFRRAKEIYNNVKKSKRKFEDLVKIYSDDIMSNKSGGDIGWQTRLTHHPNLYDMASKMKVGEISKLIDTPFGFFIVKLTGKRSFSEADHAMLRLAVQEEKKKAIFDKFIAGVRKKYPIQINKKAL